MLCDVGSNPVSGTFTPGNFCSIKKTPWNFHSRERNLHGTFAVVQNTDVIRYDTIEEFNVDSKAEYTA